MNKLSNETLLNYCDSDDYTLQAEALVELADTDFYAAVPKIIRLLHSPDSSIRSSAAYTLGYLGIEELETVGPQLMDSLKDPEEIVRSEAVEALGQLGYNPALEAIKSLLINDSSPLVRASAAETLGYLGEPEALETLELSLSNINEDEAVRGYAANSIGLLATPQMLPKLEDYINSEIPLRIKAELLGAMYCLGKKKALNFLLSFLDNADEHLGTIILNILTDLKERNHPSTLTQDAPNIGKVLRAIAQRFPILQPHTQQIMAQ
jgi:HEAT repeat protein